VPPTRPTRRVAKRIPRSSDLMSRETAKLHSIERSRQIRFLGWLDAGAALVGGDPPSPLPAQAVRLSRPWHSTLTPGPGVGQPARNAVLAFELDRDFVALSAAATAADVGTVGPPLPAPAGRLWEREYVLPPSLTFQLQSVRPLGSESTKSQTLITVAGDRSSYASWWPIQTDAS
jgi:hypothetical protein